MKYGLLIAIERELKAFLESGREMQAEEACGRTVYRTRIGENEVYALCSGCGEIDAAAGTQLLIARYGCEAILNFGVTGALDPALKVEDLFVVRKVCHYDYDSSAIDPVKPCQYLEFPDEFIPLDSGLIRKATVRDGMPDLRHGNCRDCQNLLSERSALPVHQVHQRRLGRGRKRLCGQRGAKRREGFPGADEASEHLKKREPAVICRLRALPEKESRR